MAKKKKKVSEVLGPEEVDGMLQEVEQASASEVVEAFSKPKKKQDNSKFKDHSRFAKFNKKAKGAR